MICTKCNIDHPIEYFYFDKKKNRPRQPCRAYSNMKQRERRSLKKPTIEELTIKSVYDKERQNDIKEKNKQIILQYKANKPCVDCGIVYHPYVMDFDHIDRKTKKFKISGSLNSRNGDDLIKEIEKCELRCANCHRHKTYMESLNNSILTTDNTKYKTYISNKKNIVNSLKNKPCMDCGNEYNHWQMDFDHRDPSTKIMKICDMVRKSFTIEAVLYEISKCDLVCANCHRLRTFKMLMETAT